ncbi:hypothetical protein BC629DRAFT_254380 [Irpex lacteus]|nr:hypothetical protein BC629DRAFT_254380 [Irpex lacteus]
MAALICAGRPSAQPLMRIRPSNPSLWLEYSSGSDWQVYTYAQDIQRAMSSGESKVIAGRRAMSSRTYKFSIAEAGFAAVLTHLSPAGSLGLSSVHTLTHLSLSQVQYYNTLCFTHTAHAQIEVDGLSYSSSSTHNCANVFRLSCSRTQGRNRHCHPSMCTNSPDSMTPRNMPSPLHSTLSPH